MDPPAKQKTHMEYRSAVSRLEAAIARGKIKFEEIEDETEPFDPNTQYPWEEEIREFWPTKPCTWCKEPTQKGCDFCAAQDRFPSLSWEKHHPTPVCDRCQNYHGQCYVCREEGYPDLPFRAVSCMLGDNLGVAKMRSGGKLGVRARIGEDKEWWKTWCASKDGF